MAEESEQNESNILWRWAIEDPSKPVLLSEDKLAVTFHPRRSNCCTVVRGEAPLLKHMEHWFEVEMIGPFHGQSRLVGLGNKLTRLQSSSKDFYPLIGRDKNSYALNYTGKIYHDGEEREYTQISILSEQVLKFGVYYDSYFGIIAFSIDDNSLGVAFENIPLVFDLYPMICSSSKSSCMKLIYSHSNIISLKALCRGTIRMYCSEASMEDLPLPSYLKAYLLFRNYSTPKIKDYFMPHLSQSNI